MCRLFTHKHYPSTSAKMLGFVILKELSTYISSISHFILLTHLISVVVSDRLTFHNLTSVERARKDNPMDTHIK